MSVFRADRVRAALFAAALGCVSPCAAQDIPAATGATPPAGGIEVHPLGASDGPAVGLIEPSASGLNGELWSGTPRAEIETLMAEMPLATPVGALRRLARSLLLTRADAPVGEAPHGFQTVRIQALRNGGYLDDAAALAARVTLKDDPEFARLQAETLLLAARAVEVCGPQTATRLSSSEPFWIQLRAYCYAVAGEGDLLELTRAVMKAQGSDDAAFEALLNGLLTHKPRLPASLRDPGAIDIFLMRQAGLPVDPGYAAAFGMPLAVVALRDPADPPAMRAQAAELALHSAAVTAVELGVVADAQSFSPPEIAHAQQGFAARPFFLGQALMRQAAAHAPGDARKAELIADALAEGARLHLLPVAAGLQSAIAVSVHPDQTMWAAAPSISRALLLSGNPDAAERWMELPDRHGAFDRYPAAVLAVALAFKAPTPKRLERQRIALSWLQHEESIALEPGTEGPRFAALAFALCEALGEKLPDDVAAVAGALEQTPLPGREIAPQLAERLAGAQGERTRKGEMLLAILDAVGARGPGDLSPHAAATLVHALRASGEGEAARGLAADALLLYEPAPPASAP